MARRQVASAPHLAPRGIRLLREGFDVCLQECQSLALLAEIRNGDAGSADDLASCTLMIDAAEASPLAELLAVCNLNQRNAVLLAKTLNQLLVRGLGTALGEEARLGALRVKSLRYLMQAASQTIMNQSVLQNLGKQGQFGREQIYTRFAFFIKNKQESPNTRGGGATRARCARTIARQGQMGCLAKQRKNKMYMAR